MSIGIYYSSMTGNVRRFIKKTGLEAIEIKSADTEVIHDYFVFVTYTIGIGQVPPLVAEFLKNNREKIVGVASSGNKLWGRNFANAGVIISQEFNVPLMLKFELGGLESDVRKFQEEFDKICNTLN